MEPRFTADHWSKKKGFYLFIYSFERERESESLSIHQFTLQMATGSGTETSFRSPVWVASH